MLRRTRDSLERPKRFFTGIRTEKGLRNPFLFLLIVLSITFIFLTYQHIQLFNAIMAGMNRFYAYLGLDIIFPTIDITPTTYAVAYLILIVSYILITFLWYDITHLCVRIMGGKEGYDQTYKAMTYSLSADYLALPAFIITFLTLTMTIIKRNTIVIIILIISAILYIAPSFYRLYLRLVGLEKLQKISKLRAFIATYILAYVFVFIAILAIDIIIIGIFYAVYLAFGVPLPF